MKLFAQFVERHLLSISANGSGFEIRQRERLLRLHDDFESAFTLVPGALARREDRARRLRHRLPAADRRLGAHRGRARRDGDRAQLRAAYEIAKARPNQGLRIATFLCDHGSRYASKVFNADFLASKNLVVKPLP